MSLPQPGIYRHYKGNLYRVLGTGRHSETLEEYVVYQGLYDSSEFGKNPLWVRPLNLFQEQVTVDGRSVPRFTHIGPENEKVLEDRRESGESRI